MNDLPPDDLLAEFGLTRELFREVRRAGEFSIEKVFHALVKEPFNLPYDQLQHLCPVVVKHVFFRNDADDASGNIPPAIRHRLDCQAKGMTEEEIQRTWRQKLDADPALRELHE